ncbi:MAG TPA: ABC transporter permease [Candidatus Magasanikbacteria bacterium]|nr:ABC transporter permease [Candidatus Magasanikbacteria bacterium]
MKFFDKKKIQDIVFLGFSLARANFKLRTEGKFLGVLWYLLDPLLMFLILFFVFRKNLGSTIEYFPLYLIWGLIIFNFFSFATTQAVKAVSGNGPFIKSMKITSESLVLAVLLQTAFSHFFELLIFALFLITFKIFALSMVFYLPVFLLFFIFILGTSFILATLGVYITDLSNVWAIISRILFFATPIFYIVPNKILFLANPLVVFLEISRNLVIYHHFPEPIFIFLAFIYAIIAFVVGLFLFEKFKTKFAENI